MSITTISSRKFNQDAGGAKKAAASGPVFITDRGRPAHVLLAFEAYQSLLGRGSSLLEAVAQIEGGQLEFQPPRLGGKLAKPAELA